MKYKGFSKKLQNWDLKFNDRAMPWKNEKDPYKIWLSEIILQQTRVEQGLAYYEKFIRQFPSIKALASANEKKLFKLWEGLGYYNRCKNLIFTAKEIVEQYNGIFPNTYQEILKLKGVGSYTAAAIASFAFNQPYAVVDGNVFRVLSRHFAIDTPIDTTDGKKLFTSLANMVLDKNNPAGHNQAMMDFGATVCKPVNPLCKTCIFKKTCMAFLQNRVEILPIKNKKVIAKKRQFYFFVIESKRKIALRERLEKDIWQHLHEFPVVETQKPEDIDGIIKIAQKAGWINKDAVLLKISNPFIQKLTHQVIYAVFIELKVEKIPAALSKYIWMDRGLLKNISFPKIINEYLKSSGSAINFF